MGANRVVVATTQTKVDIITLGDILKILTGMHERDKGDVALDHDLTMAIEQIEAVKRYKESL